MSKPDFHVMGLQALRHYVLSHRDDDDAFYTFVDRAETEIIWINYPEVSEKLQGDSGRINDFMSFQKIVLKDND